MTTYTQPQTETITHAKNIAAKIAADLSRLRRLVGTNTPTYERIRKYEQEATILLRDGYLGEVEYGFHENGRWKLAIKYEAWYGPYGPCLIESDPGGIQFGDNVASSRFLPFKSFLTYSAEWRKLSPDERQRYKRRRLPFVRGQGVGPSGDWGECDKDYASGNIGVKRKTIT